MRHYARKLVAPKELVLFEKIKKVVQEMPEAELGVDEDGKKILLSCHMIARALAKFFPVEVKDGHVQYPGLLACEHSWLLTKKGHIIDPYPVGLLGGPILIVIKGFSPWAPFYQEGVIPWMRQRDGHFSKNVDKVARVVCETIHSLGMYEGRKKQKRKED